LESHGGPQRGDEKKHSFKVIRENFKIDFIVPLKNGEQTVQALEPLTASSNAFSVSSGAFIFSLAPSVRDRDTAGEAAAKEKAKSL